MAEADLLAFLWAALIAVNGFAVVIWVLRSVNWWRYEVVALGDKRFSLPPGDLGWPLIGTMWSFLRAFKSSNPDSFINSFATRFRNAGLYKTVMFGKPSIIVTTPEACRRVLTDDESFRLGWPISTRKLLGRKSFLGISSDEHKRLRKLTAAPVNGHEALSIYLKYIEDNVRTALEKWSIMGRIEFLTHVRKLTFKIILHIFLGSQSEQVEEALEKEYSCINHGVRAMAINIPGFAFYTALKARKRLVAVLQSVVSDRRVGTGLYNPNAEKKDMLDLLLDAADENGRRLDNEEIVDVLIMYLNAGHESSAHISMWATIFLQNNPEVMKRAKDEQQETVKNRPPGQEGLTMKEIRQMDYLSKVIDETLRVVNVSLMSFREAKKDVNISGYTIPKGWKVIVWYRSVHFDPEVYNEPKKFDPDRWIGFTGKAGTFLPFGAGSRLCPGNDLAKLEVAIFLHYFLLDYELERDNPSCPIMHIPHPRPKDKCLGRIRRISPPLNDKVKN